MNLKKLALAAAAGTTLLAATSAFAEPRDWARERDHKWHERQHHHDHYRAPARHAYYPPRHVVERVVVMQPAPVYYAPPPARPVISTQIPIGRNSSINVDVQL
jgi:hypothetical protein